MARKSADGLEALNKKISELERENALLRRKIEEGPHTTFPEADQSVVEFENARMQALLQGATDYAIIETDPQGRITYWNSGATTLLGWSEDEAIGQNVSLLFTPDDRRSGEPERERQEAMSAGRSDAERWHVRKDGSRFYAHERLIASEEQPSRFLKVLRIEAKSTRTKRHVMRAKSRCGLSSIAQRTMRFSRSTAPGW